MLIKRYQLNISVSGVMTTTNFKMLAIATMIAAIFVPMNAMAETTSESLRADLVIRHQALESLTADFIELKQLKQSVETIASKSSFKSSMLTSIQLQLESVENQMDSIRSKIASDFTMDPTKKAKYRVGQQILEANQDTIPWYALMVSSITQKITIDMLPEHQNQGYEEKIESLIGSDIEYEIRYRVDDYQDWSCTGQQVDCTTLVGGIKIYNTVKGEPGCTLSLPMKQGTTWGFVTAAHCFSVGHDAYQPNTSSTIIGDVQSGDYRFGGDCDCVFITKSGSENKLTSVWLASNVYTSIVQALDLSDGSSAMMQGQVSGADWGTVEDTEATRTNKGVQFTGLTIFSGLAGAPGDSGAPIIEPVGGKYHGLLKGGSAIEQWVVPWSNIDGNLGLVDP